MIYDKITKENISKIKLTKKQILSATLEDFREPSVFIEFINYYGDVLKVNSMTFDEALKKLKAFGKEMGYE